MNSSVVSDKFSTWTMKLLCSFPFAGIKQLEEICHPILESSTQVDTPTCTTFAAFIFDHRGWGVYADALLRVGCLAVLLVGLWPLALMRDRMYSCLDKYEANRNQSMPVSALKTTFYKTIGLTSAIFVCSMAYYVVAFKIVLTDMACGGGMTEIPGFGTGVFLTILLVLLPFEVDMARLILQMVSVAIRLHTGEDWKFSSTAPETPSNTSKTMMLVFSVSYLLVALVMFLATATKVVLPSVIKAYYICAAATTSYPLLSAVKNEHFSGFVSGYMGAYVCEKYGKRIKAVVKTQVEKAAVAAQAYMNKGEENDSETKDDEDLENSGLEVEHESVGSDAEQDFTHSELDNDADVESEQEDDTEAEWQQISSEL